MYGSRSSHRFRSYLQRCQLITSLLVQSHLVLHALAELAPRGVNDDDSWGGLDGLDGVVDSELLDLGSLPEVAVEGLFGSGNVDAAFGLSRTVLVGESNEPGAARSERR